MVLDVTGLVGTLLLDRFLELKWMVRTKEPRAPRLTHAGRVGMADLLGLKYPDVLGEED